MPVYNDWESFQQITKTIDSVFIDSGEYKVQIVVIDDGSSKQFDKNSIDINTFNKIESINILHLNCNMGSQRSIAIGLSYINNNMQGEAVIVMDADGEDKPEDLLRLLDENSRSMDQIIVARRDKRSETIVFRLFYNIYKVLFRLLTGHVISFGNYCLIPFDLLRKLIYRSELWNNLPATIIRSGIPIKELSTTRGERIAGKSNMKFASLIVHGLSTISVYSDISLVRILIGCLVLFVLTVLGILSVTFIRLGTDFAIPGWASDVAGSLLIILLQVSMASIFVIFLVLNNRSQRLFIPNKHYEEYIFENESLH